MTIQQTVIAAFEQQFGESPTHIVRAPGRVNLIGEHTDYNDGFVLPMAIDRAVWIALRPTNTPSVSITSLDFDEPIMFDLSDYTKQPNTPSDYVKGMTWALQNAGHQLKGWEGVMKGDVPIGSGLSSSAALELAIARAFSVVSGLDWDAAQMALLAQKAENDWLGVKTGIMDQMISASGKVDHALLIDCRSLDTELLQIPTGTAVVILDTNTRRGLVDSAYNERRQQCEAAAAHFGVSHLRDVTLEQFHAKKSGLDALIAKRAYHVISEDARTIMAKQAMIDNDAHMLGLLMTASHISLRDYFEVTNDALRLIVDIAQAHPASYGARMTGAGFGGCAVALIAADAVEDFTSTVATQYLAQSKREATLYVTTPTNGAEIIK
ncbi:MAG: galactokinase [Phototrophicaceae bacterium]